MSAFIVEPETMSLAVSAIDYARRSLWKPSELCGFNPTGELDSMPTPSELGRRFYTLNQEAIRQRYPGDEDYASIPPDYQHPQSFFSFDGCNHAREFTAAEMPHVVASYKALCCLTYQCSEGNVPETDTYKRLIECEQFLAANIVCSLPEYAAAAWG